MKIYYIFLITFITNFVYGQNIDTVIYTSVDVMPYFEYKTGSNIKESLKLFTTDSLRLPSQDDCIGKIYVRFIVEIDSKLSNIEILRGLDNCNGFNEEAIRFIKSMPAWIPAFLNGNKVRAYMTIPVNFNMNGY